MLSSILRKFHDDIEKDMNKRNSTSRRKNDTCKQQEQNNKHVRNVVKELSVSAAKVLKRKKYMIVVKI